MPNTGCGIQSDQTYHGGFLRPGSDRCLNLGSVGGFRDGLAVLCQVFVVLGGKPGHTITGQSRLDIGSRHAGWSRRNAGWSRRLAGWGRAARAGRRGGTGRGDSAGRSIRSTRSVRSVKSARGVRGVRSAGRVPSRAKLSLRRVDPRRPVRKVARIFALALLAFLLSGTSTRHGDQQCRTEERAGGKREFWGCGWERRFSWGGGRV